MHVSDLATGDGKYVADDYWGGHKNGNRFRDIIWPTQGKPKSSAWTIWRRVLKQCVCSENRMLRNPVGRWLEPIKIEDIDHWDWFWDTNDNTLKRLTDGHWYQYIPHNHYLRTRGGDEKI